MTKIQGIFPYILAIFLSALLIFWVEPFFTKMLLPPFGGAPTVWIAALMFFQAVLLTGYIYSHLLTKIKGSLYQGMIHLSLGVVAFFFLPPTLSDIVVESIIQAPLSMTLLMLLKGVALPMVVLSATAPLVQHWFSLTGHTKAHDPYFLYAASNVGSLGALVAFPLFFEPFLTLKEQAGIWTGLFVLAMAMVFLCSLLVRKKALAKPQATPSALKEKTKAPLTRQDWVWLIGLSAVPASLLSGVTLAITTDVAAVPLFWILPLMIYLVTFILAFGGWRVVSDKILHLVIGLLMIPTALVILFGPPLLTAFGLNFNLVIILLLAVQFFLSLACHQELRRRRPSTIYLTRYYIAIALGGLIGGTFNALVAPMIFTNIVEFPIALVLALALSRQGPEGGVATLKAMIPALLVALLLGGAIFAFAMLAGGAVDLLPALLLAASVAVFTLAPYQRTHALILGSVFLVGAGFLNTEDEVYKERSFFGVNAVIDVPDIGVRRLKNGTTIHGAQYLDTEKSRLPLTYYGSQSPVSEIFKLFNAKLAGKSIASVGLGVGSLACYKTPGQRWVYYELDPAVVKIATNPEYFTFMSQCDPGAEIIVGDARLNLVSGDQVFSLLVLDAFTSDSVPVHLLTREAFAAYKDHLAPDGIIIVHISNRHLDMSPLMAAIAEDSGLLAAIGRSNPDADPNEIPSEWAVFTTDPSLLQALIDAEQTHITWQKLGETNGMRAWTDDYSNILTLLKWGTP